MAEKAHWSTWDAWLIEQPSWDGKVILDPDGFRHGKPEVVTLEEFLAARSLCTIGPGETFRCVECKSIVLPSGASTHRPECSKYQPRERPDEKATPELEFDVQAGYGFRTRRPLVSVEIKRHGESQLEVNLPYTYAIGLGLQLIQAGQRALSDAAAIAMAGGESLTTDEASMVLREYRLRVFAIEKGEVETTGVRPEIGPDL